MNKIKIIICKRTKKDKSRKSAIITGVICVLLCIIGALYIWHKQTQKPPVQLDVNSAIATVDIDKLMSKHSDYAKLEKIASREDIDFNKIKIICIKYRTIATTASRSGKSSI